jgi:hypothetical protein
VVGLEIELTGQYAQPPPQTNKPKKKKEKARTRKESERKLRKPEKRDMLSLFSHFSLTFT